MPPSRHRVVWVTLLAIFVVHAWIVCRALPRPLDHDEGEHLRAASWVASGKSIYRDFSENHTPYLYLLLAPLAPHEQSIEALRRYVTLARVAGALAGTLAVLCVAAIAIRLGGHPLAAVPVLAALYATGWTWLRALADVRAEPYTLLLFWLGALLVLWRGRILYAGIGIGLIAVAGVWNPKWPIESVVLFCVFAAQWWQAMRQSRRDAIASLAIAIAFPVLAVCLALTVTSLPELIFHGYVYPGAIAKWFRTSPLSAGLFPPIQNGFAFCAAWLRPWFAAIAAILCLLTIRQSRRFPVVFTIALFAAAALEVFVLYPYPRLWPQYFAMWACVVALLYGVTVARIVERAPRLAPAIAIAIAVAWIAYEWRFVQTRADERHWRLKAALLARLGPGDAAWIRPEELPVNAPAGSYYWYAFTDQVPFSLVYAQSNPRFLPQLRDEDLPPCRVLAGRAPEVRLLDARAVRSLPRSRQCFEQLRARGVIVRLGSTPIWEVRAPLIE